MPVPGELSDSDVFGAAAVAPSQQQSVGQQAISNVRAGRPAISPDARSATMPREGEMSDDDVFGAPKQHGIVANIGAGTNEATTGMLGAPVDLVTGALNLVPRGINAATGTNLPTIQKPVGGSEWLTDHEKNVGDATGLSLDPRDVEATTKGEELGRAAGAGAASMILPGGIAKALPELAGVAGAAQRAFRTGSTAAQGAVGATAGVGGQEAADQAPDWAKPIANLAGQVAGGGLAGLVEAGGRALVGGAGTAARDLAAPLTNKGRQDLAAERLQGAATDRGDAINALTDNPRELVPGALPTTFQASGDQGLGNLERAVATRSPAPFLARAAEQNKARVEALAKLAPEDATPQAVGDAFRQQLADLDAGHEAAVGLARQNAQAATERIGGNLPATTEDQAASAKQIYGQQLRDSLAKQNQAAKRAEGGLWDAVDPDRTLAVDMKPLKQAATALARDVPENSGLLDGPAGKLIDLAQQQKPVQPFSELSALRGRITDEMRGELMTNGRTQVYGLMSKLLDAVHDTMEGRVQQQAAEDALGVQAGAMTPEQTMLSRLKAASDQWYEERASQSEARRGSSPGSGSDAGVGSAAVSGSRGAEGEAGGGSGDAEGGASLPGAQGPLEPNFDADAAARYAAARQATAQRHATFNDAPGVGAALASGKRAGDFKLPDSSVPSTIFTPGKGAAERIQAYQRAGGDPATLSDYAAFDLRRAAQDPDGTLNPGRYDRWMAQHTEALSAMPAELRSGFQSAAAARQTLEDATVRQTDARTTFQASALGRFLPKSAEGETPDPVKVVGDILRGKTAVPDMKRLAAATARDPDARAGLQRTVADLITRDLRTNAEAGSTGETGIKSDMYQTFVRKNAPALSAIFEPKQLESMRAVAADLQRANKSVSGTKLPGGSNTAQDTIAARRLAGNPSILRQMIGAEVAGSVAARAADAVGASVPGVGTMASIGALALGSLRSAGFEHVNQLVAEAMLNPDLGKALLLRPLPGRGEASALSMLSQQLRATAMSGAATSGRNQPQPVRRKVSAQRQVALSS